MIGTCPITGNGDWQTYVDASCSVSGVSGKHDVYLKFTGGSGYLFNLNWFKFTGVTVKAGDLNRDASVDATDYALMKMYMLGIPTNLPVQIDPAVADLNSDGAIDAIDLAVFKKYLLGDIADLILQNKYPNIKAASQMINTFSWLLLTDTIFIN